MFHIKLETLEKTVLSILYEIIEYLSNKSRISKKSTEKKFQFSTTSGKKNVKFEDFRRNNCVFTKVIAKNCAFQKISRKKKLQ